MNNQPTKKPNQPNQPKPNSDRGSRKFRGIWIPSEIWENDKLTIQQKVFLSEIDSLAGRSGCFASNAYFGKFFGLSKSRVSNVISSLQKLGLIEINLIKSESGRNVEKRIIKPTGEQRTPLISQPKSKPKPESPSKYIHAVKPIIFFLNSVAGSDYKPNTAATIKHVTARINEGFSVDDFKTVITDRVRLWRVDDKMKQFIRPETLFGNKFESYLNAANQSIIKASNKAITAPVDFGERAKPNAK